jgi:hypothetical protein
MAKKLYRIPVEWAVTGTMLVEAESLAEALVEAEDAPLPRAEDFIEGTFEINHQMIPFCNKKLSAKELEELEATIQDRIVVQQQLDDMPKDF